MYKYVNYDAKLNANVNIYFMSLILFILQIQKVLMYIQDAQETEESEPYNVSTRRAPNGWVPVTLNDSDTTHNSTGALNREDERHSNLSDLYVGAAHDRHSVSINLQ